jgi:hypothetical protein
VSCCKMLHHAEVGGQPWQPETSDDNGSFPFSSRVFSGTQQSKFHAVSYTFLFLLFSFKRKRASSNNENVIRGEREIVWPDNYCIPQAYEHVSVLSAKQSHVTYFQKKKKLPYLQECLCALCCFSNVVLFDRGRRRNDHYIHKWSCCGVMEVKRSKASSDSFQ